MKTCSAEAARVPLARQIEDIVLSTPVVDVHTHLYDPAFKELLLLWGIDDLLFIITWSPNRSATWICLTRSSGRSRRPHRRS